MKILLSPAKSLDFESKLPIEKATQPIFLAEAERLNAVLEKKSKKQLKELMGISENLAELNYQRYKAFSTPFNAENSRPAIYAFSGDVYVGLDAYTIPKNKIQLLQDRVRILSGLYGVLKPLDFMQPYRLEMGTDLKVNTKKNLYEFWGNKITEALNKELEKEEIVLNLASNEYFKSVNTKKLEGRLISPVFKDYKNGKLKIISFFAKKARGSMARFVIDNNVNNYEKLLSFDVDGYQFSRNETKNENKPVFIR
ncbi:MAG: peroxide stress protein YaaA [Flavobacteriaceae bacterium]|nr:peroxide stress protein YaaA [Flavobacteriaceae bacterium]